MPVSAPDIDVTARQHPSGVNSMDVAQWFCYLLGSAITHIWDAGQLNHNSVVDDLKVARHYLDLKIAQLERDEGKPHV